MFIGLSATAITSAVPAMASPPQDVTIIGNFATSTWTASGAINDSGSYSEYDVALSGSIFHSPNGGVAHDTVTFTDAAGSTFTIENQDQFDSPFSGTGEWTVHGGTGSYSGLAGTGRFAFSFVAGQVVLHGQVHYH
jgi:hypothetical protein